MKYKRVYIINNCIYITDKWMIGEIIGHIINGKYRSLASDARKREQINKGLGL